MTCLPARSGQGPSPSVPLRIPSRGWFAAGLFLSLGLALAGCSSEGPEDVAAWMRLQRASAHTALEALPVVTPFASLPYDAGPAADPFDPQRLAQVLRQDAGAAARASRLLGPELHRAREPLEALALDTIRMVGSLTRQGRRVALVRVEGQIHTVQVGQYLGQNYGRITRITETAILLREIVQDPGGEWIERAATLPLQEKS